MVSRQIIAALNVALETDAYWFLRVLATGLGATLLMDLLALLLKRVFGIPASNYCLVGRWLGHMPTGTFVHANITKATPVRLECALGWTAHFAIGGMYAFLFVALAPDGWLLHPTFLPALLFGVVTVVVPFCIMQPSFGLGIAAARTPDPFQARMKSLMAHTAFGIGLYVCAKVLIA